MTLRLSVLWALLFLVGSCKTDFEDKCPESSEHNTSLSDDAPVENPAALHWSVVRVIDGDTLVVRLEEPGRAVRTETVRLLRINTPEREQIGYTEAREVLMRLVRGGEVTLEFENQITFLKQLEAVPLKLLRKS